MTLGDYAISFALFVPGVIVGRIVGGLVIGWFDARRARRIASAARSLAEKTAGLANISKAYKEMRSGERLGFPDCRLQSCPVCKFSREEKQP